MASSAPAATVGLTFAGLAAVTAYGAGPILLLTAIPMLIIANAYRRLNLWKANTGASFEWVGRAINPYLGFLAGWLMIAAYIVGTTAEVLLLGPSVLAVFGSSSTNTWADVGIGVATGLIMLVIAVVGIKITARVQVSMALVEYVILIGLAIAGLVWVLSHQPGSVPFSRGWLSLNGIDGKGRRGGRIPGRGVCLRRLGRHPVRQRGSQAPPGEPGSRRHPRRRPAGHPVHAGPGRLPGRALAGQAGGRRYQWHRDYRRGAGPGRRVLGQGDGTVDRPVGHRHHRHRHRARRPHRLRDGQLPRAARLPRHRIRRYAIPVASSVIVGLLIIALSAVYFLATSVQNAFNDVIAVTGFLFSIFYILTAVAAMTYYRRRIAGRPWDFVTVGLLPLGAAGFLGWVFVKSLG
jgi:amino acid transporter